MYLPIKRRTSNVVVDKSGPLWSFENDVSLDWKVNYWLLNISIKALKTQFDWRSISFQLNPHLKALQLYIYI